MTEEQEVTLSDTYSDLPFKLPSARVGEAANFKLYLPWPLSGDQPEAVQALTESVQAGNRDQTLLGVTGSGKTATMAAVIVKLGRPALILSHNRTLAAQLYGEFQDLMGEKPPTKDSPGRPGAAVAYFSSAFLYYQPEAYIPQKDLFIEKDSAVSEEIERLRHMATSALLSRRDVVIVSTVSCIYGLGSPADYGNLTLHLEVGRMYKRQEVLRHLVDIQYQRNEMAFNRGAFRVRGDTLEVYQASQDVVTRVEFFGDVCERISIADPLTGELISTHTSIEIFPAKHWVTPQDKLDAALISIDAELEERLKFLKSENKLLEAQRLEQRTRFDLELIKESGFCGGMENYSRHLAQRPAGSRPWTLLDYFPPDFIAFVDESHMTLPQVRGMYNGDHARKQTLVDYGFRLPSALDNRPLMFNEFEDVTDTRIYVSATPAAYELEKSSVIAQQVVRPTGLLDPTVTIKPTKGQIDDLYAEILERTKKGQRTLITTITKKMAEDLTDYFKDLGVKVQYLHSDVETIERSEILRDLRLGVFDVIVGINLLREGLDLPEVTLVAILDADKEGFLRSESSLIQTMGRAARHVEGHVIMYADRVTDSMRKAIDVVEARRTKQTAYNLAAGITPASIQKAIREITERLKPIEEALPEKMDVSQMSTGQLRALIGKIDEEMKKSARDLEFEQAALLRDQLVELRGILTGSSAAGAAFLTEGGGAQAVTRLKVDAQLKKVKAKRRPIR